MPFSPRNVFFAYFLQSCLLMQPNTNNAFPMMRHYRLPHQLCSFCPMPASGALTMVLATTSWHVLSIPDHSFNAHNGGMEKFFNSYWIVWGDFPLQIYLFT